MAIDAVIFDWGGTLTPWRETDGRAWWRICQQVLPAGRVDAVTAALCEAEQQLWDRARSEYRSGTLAEILALAGMDGGEDGRKQFYQAFEAEWEPHTQLDPDAPEVLAGLRHRGIRVGVLSNTTWPRSHHERIFARDGVLDAFDGAVYSCEIPWTKPHPESFRAAIAAVGATDPARCVYVGDRPFEDIYGAHQAGMRAVLVPHSVIPSHQRGHTEDTPDAVVSRLSELLDVVDAWSGGAVTRQESEQ